jgi:hypothetical protein
VDKKVKVVMGIPTMEFARQARFYDALYSIQKPENTLMSLAHGQSPASNRNAIIKNALADPEVTHVFFIDDDVLIPSDALMKLLAHDKDIVSGLYLFRSFPHAPIAFNAAMSDGKCRFKFLNDDETGLVQVANIGLGCVLIKREVFERLGGPNWITIGQLNSQEWNDDIEFFNRCRSFGYKLWLDLDVRCGHMASVAVWPDYQDGKWLTVYDTQGRGNAAFFPAGPKQLYPDDMYEQMLARRRAAGEVLLEV